MSRSTSRNVVRDNPNPAGVWPEILRGYRSAAAVMAFSFPGTSKFCAQVQFRSAVNVKHRVLWCRPFRYPYTSVSGRCLARKYTVNCRESVPTWQFLAPTSKSTSQYSSQLYAMPIRQKLSPPVRCVCSTSSKVLYLRDNTTKKLVTSCDTDVHREIQKSEDTCFIIF
jgi:hypothetical protein